MIPLSNCWLLAKGFRLNCIFPILLTLLPLITNGPLFNIFCANFILFSTNSREQHEAIDADTVYY